MQEAISKRITMMIIELTYLLEIIFRKKTITIEIIFLQRKR